MRPISNYMTGRPKDALNDVGDLVQWPLMEQTPNNSQTKRSLMRDARALGSTQKMVSSASIAGKTSKLSRAEAEQALRKKLKEVRSPKAKKGEVKKVKAQVRSRR
jgi:hypothetical protein